MFFLLKGNVPHKKQIDILIDVNRIESICCFKDEEITDEKQNAIFAIKFFMESKDENDVCFSSESEAREVLRQIIKLNSDDDTAKLFSNNIEFKEVKQNSKVNALKALLEM